jgi:hypothetical protein
MDEGNRLKITDVDFENGLIHVPGTKTEESNCYLPMSPALQEELKSYLQTRTDDSPNLFPGRSTQTKGKKIDSRRRLFEKIKRLTAFKAYMEKSPNTPPMTAWKELKKQNYPGRRKAHDEGIERLLCDSGVSAGERPEHGKGSDAAH